MVGQLFTIWMIVDHSSSFWSILKALQLLLIQPTVWLGWSVSIILAGLFMGLSFKQLMTK
jgi:hypothetical protein